MRIQLVIVVLVTVAAAVHAEPAAGPITLSWERNMLSIHAGHIPGGKLQVYYLEAYCRPGSTDADWVKHTVIGHETQLIEASDDGRTLKLRCTLSDGVVVDHTITVGRDEVDFRLAAHNPTDKVSEAHWAQPCIRVGEFTGCGADQTDDKYAYIRKSFVFIAGRQAMMPTPEWATEARYTPGQVWRPGHVPADDVNPRPVNPRRPSNGLIGCYSGDGKWILATAWEPYQELFQGVIRCLHSDFRLGGLGPGERKEIRGKIYLVPADVEKLLRRYEGDFPEHR